MPLVQIGSTRFFAPASREELAGMMAAANAEQRTLVRARKWMRLPVMSGTPASSAISLGVAEGDEPVGPAQGYAWSIGRLAVSGLTSGTTPDVVNIYRNDAFAAGPYLWQFTGNAPCAQFGKLRMVLEGGDTLSLQNVGSIAATGLITLSGELIEVPAERLGELA